MNTNNDSNQSKIENNWFREINADWEGISLALQVEKVLYHGRSKYQDVLVLKSKSFGNVLVLDGVIQCTERDEFAYQEMITHIPMNIHPCPKQVLVIGGGDGGVVREVLKYSSVEEVILCEIDQMVIDVSKEHLPNMASCLSDKRVNIQVGNGIKFVRENKNRFDVIITDSSDPTGAAVGLFEKSFYEELRDALRPHGVVCCQGETPFLDGELVKDIVSTCRNVFPRVGYAVGHTPTYISGLMGYLVCSNSKTAELNKPTKTLSENDVEKMSLKYYNSHIHTSAFVLPNYIRSMLKDVIDT